MFGLWLWLLLEAPTTAKKLPKIAFLIFGSSHHGKRVNQHVPERCSEEDKQWQSFESEWTRAAIESQKTFLFEALQNGGVVPRGALQQQHAVLPEQRHKKQATVDVFLSVDSCSPEFDAAILSLYRPFVKAAVFNDPTSSRRDKFRAAAALALLNSSGYDAVALSRPDLLWSGTPQNLSTFFFDSDVIAWPHPCEPDAWRNWQCVSDLLIVVPAAYVEAFFTRCDDALYHRFLQSAHYSYNCALRKRVLPSPANALFLFGDVQVKVNTRGMHVADVPVPFFEPDNSPFGRAKLMFAKQNARLGATFRHYSSRFLQSNSTTVGSSGRPLALFEDLASWTGFSDKIEHQKRRRRRRSLLNLASKN